MKLYSLPILSFFLSFGCGQSENTPHTITPLPKRDMTDVSYGNDPEQTMDVYLPVNRDQNTKTIILVHGGGWSGGSKAEFTYLVGILKTEFPDHAIVNMNYRLGTMQSSGFPKQVQDLELAIAFLKSSDYNISNRFAFIGASAGAHLALLYSYRHNPSNEVGVVCSIVGPTDFTDPAYTNHPMFQYGLMALVGNANYANNPEVFLEVSPATHVNSQSAPTILFYGGQDPLIPVSQATRLKNKLDDVGVTNEYYLYPSAGHGNWNLNTTTDFRNKLVAFFKANF